jgi:hypothetical protein
MEHIELQKKREKPPTFPIKKDFSLNYHYCITNFKSSKV